MLLSFRFANHRSFRDEQQLLLIPVYAAPEQPEQLDAVPVIGIFGANASGKSNALQAIWYMRHLILNSDRDVEPGLGLPRDPFAFDDSLHKPATYVVDLLVDKHRTTYGFAVD